jgi:DNA-binding transcriptional LysR family regulator
MPKDLGQFPLILFTPETPTRRAIDRFFRKHGVRPNIVMELDHIATIKHAVEVDIGISIVPLNAIEQEIGRNTIVYLPFSDKHFVRPLGILYRKGRSLSVATQKLLDVLMEGSGRQRFSPEL